jgi:hypothetical protein
LVLLPKSCQAKGDFVFIWFALPRAELGAVAAFVAEGVKMQGLVAILEPGTAIETLARFGQTSTHLLQM